MKIASVTEDVMHRDILAYMTTIKIGLNRNDVIHARINTFKGVWQIRYAE